MCGSELTPKPQGLTPADVRLAALAKRVLQGDDVPPSPCISICRMSDDTTYCEGCWRTLDEIGAWGQSSTDAKRALWQLIGQRIGQHIATPKAS